jgi:hypothetical protein
MKKISLRVLSLFGLCFLCSCGGSPSPPPPPPAGTHFVVNAAASTTAGTPLNFTVTALDASGNVEASYAGTVHFTSTDARAILPTDTKLSGGTTIRSVTLKTGGPQLITAADTVTASISGASNTIIVNPGPVAQFILSAPSNAPAGTPFQFSVSAIDAYNNPGSYTGTMHFACTDSKATLPADQAPGGGPTPFNATLKSAGNQTITVNDTVATTIKGSSSAIDVGGGATHFAFSNVPTNATVGSAFAFTVTAHDASNNADPNYSGTVHFTSTDSKADLPPDQFMASGTQSFSVGLKSTGSEKIMVADAFISVAGTSSAINVTVAAAANPVPFVNQPLTPETVAPGGGTFPLTVNGTGFVSGSKVQWNGTPLATTFVSSSKLMATVPATNIADFNTASVTVLNPSPGGGSSNVVFFGVTLPTTSIAVGTSQLNTAGSTPYSVATADFNHDGKLDLVVANKDSNNVTVLLGKGDGTFQTPVNYAVGTNPYAVAVGDLNQDGKLDLAVANIGGSTSILLGNGDGTFQAAVNYATPCCASSVALADLNGDGKVDLVVATTSVTVLLGNGDGTFQPALNYPAGTGPSTVAVGDFNGDGKLDLAVANFNSANLSVLIGNGDGTFQAPLDYAVGPQPQSLVTADFNGDGILDLAVANSAGNTVSVLMGNGNGTFQTAVDYSTNSFYPYWVAIGDFNGDGKLDLAVSRFSFQDVFIFSGNGDGTFQPGVAYGTSNTLEPFSIAVGDFNNQGRLGLAVANSGPSNVSLLQQSTLAPSSNDLTFPVQLVPTASTAQPLTLTNAGPKRLTISGVAISGTNAADFSDHNGCSSPLAPGTSCTVGLTFTPAQIGQRSALVTITDDSPDNSQTVALAGTGVVAGPNANLAPPTLKISCQTHCRVFCSCVCSYTPNQQPLLSDFGNADLNISSIAATAPFGESNNCGTGLTPGNSCTIRVGITTHVHGTYTGTLDVNDNAPGSPHQVILQGSVSCP